jgi:hypothetical protein
MGSVLMLEMDNKLAGGLFNFGDKAVPSVYAVIHPSMTPLMPDAEAVGDYHGVKFYTSSLVPREKAFLIQRDSVIPRDMEIKISHTAASVLDQLIYRSLGMPYAIQNAHLQFPRLFGESFLAWSNRIFCNGLLDDPELRAEYQEIVFRSIIVWIRGKIRNTLINRPFFPRLHY